MVIMERAKVTENLRRNSKIHKGLPVRSTGRGYDFDFGYLPGSQKKNSCLVRFVPMAEPKDALFDHCSTDN